MPRNPDIRLLKYQIKKAYDLALKFINAKILKQIILIIIILFSFHGIILAQDDTEKFFIEQVKNNPKLADSYYNLGFYYHTNNNNKNTIHCLKKAIQIKPDYYEAHVILGEAYINSGEKKLAIQEFKKALELKPESKEIAGKISLLENEQRQLDISKPSSNQTDSTQKDILQSSSDNERNSTYNLFSDENIQMILKVLILFLILLVIPAFFLLLGSIIAKIDSATLYKSILATIASNFIFLLILYMSIFNFYISYSIGMIAGFVLSIITIQAIYETLFGKALVAWIFGTILFVIADYILLLMIANVPILKDFSENLKLMLTNKNGIKYSTLFNSKNSKTNNMNLKKSCISNMKNIESACALYKMDSGNKSNITVQDLHNNGYLKIIPKCPLGQSNNSYEIINGEKIDIKCLNHNIKFTDTL